MGGLITLAFISGYDDDRLLRWMTHSQKGELCTLTKGKIIFYLGDFDGIILFEYKFNDTALIYWKEKFTAVGEEPMIITMTISAAIQEVKGIILVKPWQESWVKPSEQIPYQSTETLDNEPKVIDYYITDLNNERTNKILAGDKILLNIHSKNMIDELFSIKLNNQTIDFKYKGEVLIDDTLNNYKIGSNNEKIELEAIKQEV